MGDYVREFGRRIMEQGEQGEQGDDALARLVVAVTGITPSAAMTPESVLGAVARDFLDEHAKVPTDEEYRYACGEWAKTLQEIADGRPPVESPGTITDFMRKQGKPMHYDKGKGIFVPGEAPEGE